MREWGIRSDTPVLTGSEPIRASGAPDPPTRGPAGRRASLLLVAGAVAGLVLLMGLFTQGTFDPGHATTHDPQARFYDAQARAIVHGRLDVPVSALGLEAVPDHGRTYGYFGVGPALLRLPVMVFYPHSDPNLAPWSFLAAFAVLAAATAGIWSATQRRLGVAAPLWAGSILVVAVLAGSPAMFLTARPDMYEEAIVWGVAAAVLTGWAVLRLLEAPNLRWAAVAVLAAAFAMSCRATVGAGALATVGLAGLVLLARDRARWPLTVGLLGGAAAGLAGFCLVNWLKFQRLLSAPANLNYRIHPARLAALRHGGSNGLRYLPTNLVEYLRPDTLHFTGTFPWVTFRMPAYAPVLNIGHVHFDTFELPTSITATAPLLTVLAVVGTVAVFRRPSSLAVPLAGGLLAAFATATFFGEAPRYLGDFVPWLVVGAAAGLAVVIRWEPTRRWVKPAVYTAGGVALVWSVYVSAALAHALAHAYRTHDYFNAS